MVYTKTVKVPLFKPGLLPLGYLLSCILIFSQCRVHLLPEFDSSILEQIDQTAKRVDKFYLELLELDPANIHKRSYSSCSDSYIAIQSELNSLYIKNKIRPLNKNTLSIIEITRNLWIKYKTEHKQAQTLTNGIIELNRQSMEELFYTMRIAEKVKKQ
ncbi:MAG: hypothetical protein JNL65_03470 [Saprospiraceae bacterium]|nr:hypothetical protein [Saprospiraceae bacterium]HRG67760.1 hypothetical protein [Saprospiraceae bacterium]